MVLTKFVNVKINNHSMPHYRALGYDVKMFDTITVPIGHLTPKSTVKIRVKCDYCGAEYEITYSSYTKNIELDERLGKARTDACIHCRHIKAKDTFNDKYGEDNPMKVKSIRDGAVRTNLEKYGCANPIQNELINKKRIDTLNSKYGVDNPMKVKEFARKQYNSMCDENGNLCSYCQRYLTSLYDGIMNYRYASYMFDIYIERYNIDVEVNGSGHNIDVTLEKQTKIDFENKELNRINKVKAAGFKQIIFVLTSDKLPSDAVLLSLLDFAVKKFHSETSIIYFYVDENYIMIDNDKVYYDYKTITNLTAL